MSMRRFSPGAQACGTLCDHLAMQILAPCVVTLTWTLSDAQNRPIDELKEPVEFYFGGDDLLPKVEEALLGHAVGDTLRLHLEPEHAFGDYRAELVCFEDRRLFPEQLEAGMAFEGLPAGHATPDMPADAIYVVTEVYPSHVVLDGNHPLAGMALRLDLKVRDVRAASDVETEARSVGGTPVTVLASGNSPGGAPLH
jgi:FKBP-type peptidyl-prolyl cis-trans isomerase SlyD